MGIGTIVGLITPLLAKYWRIILAGIAALIIALGSWYVSSLRGTVAKQKVQITDLTNQTIDLTNQKNQIQANYDGLKMGLQQQADLISKLSAQATSMSTALDTLNRTINGDISNLGTKLGSIINQKMSKLTCDQAIDFLRQNALGAQQ